MKHIYHNGMLILAIAIVLIAPVSAALTVTPMQFVMDSQTGNVNTLSIKLSSANTDPATTYEIIPKGLGNGRDGSYIPIEPNADISAVSARPSTTLDQTEVTLNPGESKTINATILIPMHGVGGIYGMISIRQKNDVANTINIPVLITISNVPYYDSGKVFDVIINNETDPITVSSVFVNTGVHHLKNIKNTISVTNEFGSTVNFTSTIPDRVIVPDGTIAFRQPINTNFEQGSYYIRSEFTTEKGELLGYNTTSYSVYIDPSVIRQFGRTPTLVNRNKPSDGIQTNPIEVIKGNSYSIPVIVAISLIVIIIGIAIAISNRKQKKKLTYKK